MARRIISQLSDVARNGRFCRLILCLTVTLMLTHFVDYRANAQDRASESMIEQLGQALVRGDSKSLIGMASGGVDLAFDGESRVYSVIHARRVISEYFSDHRFVSFSVVDFKKTSRGWFIEGKLKLQGGQSMRVYLRLIRTEGEWFLRELFFETLGDSK